MIPTSLTSSNPSSNNTSSNNTTSTSTTSSSSSFHSRHGSTISVLSVPLLDPFYKDLVALKTDHEVLYAELKRTQQTLQLSYQDLMMVQERSKRAETDSGRLKNQMETILKKHVDHHPEREALVQQLAELQTRFNIELGARRVLEQEHSQLQHELMRYRFNNNSNNTNGTSTTSAQLDISNPPPPSPVSSIRSVTLSLFSGVGSRKSRNSTNTGSSSNSSSSTNNNHDRPTRTPSIRSVCITDEIQYMQETPIVSASAFAQPPPHLLHSHHLLSAPSTPRTTTISSNFTSISTPPGPQTPAQQQQYQHYGTKTPAAELTVIQDMDHENLATIQACLPSMEQLEGQRLFNDKLAEENVAMRMEIQDLRYRNKAEKDSIKGYMSLFESLQKKQSNALAVAQAEIDVLRATLQEHTLRLESREALLQTFAATVNSQAIQLEILTKDACRERTSRAKTEQEMASLLEASLLMLERLFANVDQSVRSGLVKCLDPIRQTIHHLEIPGILQEWELCEQGVQSVINELTRSLVMQQEVQERGLMIEGSVVGGGGGDNTGTLVKAIGTSSRSSSIFGGNSSRNHRGSISSTHSAMTTFSSGNNHNSNNNNNRNSIEQGEAMMILDNNFSQQVFVWRKITADTFLEQCVKSVEDLAQERRELQTRIVELTRAIVEQEEAHRLKELAARGTGAMEERKKEKEEEEKESVAEKKEENGERGEEVAAETEVESVVVDKETGDVITGTLNPDTNPPPAETPPRKDSLGEMPANYASSGGDSVGQENHPKDLENHLKDPQESSSSPLNIIDNRNRRSSISAEKEKEEDSDERTRRLEMILQKVLEWSGSYPQFSKGSSSSSAEKLQASGALAKGLGEDDILSLGISEAPATLEERAPLTTVMRAEVGAVEDVRVSNSPSSSTMINGDDFTIPRKDDLEALLQMIRKELPESSFVSSAGCTSLLTDNSVDDSSSVPTVAIAEETEETEEIAVIAGGQEEPAEMESLLPIETPPTTKSNTPTATATTLNTTTDTSASTNDTTGTTTHTTTTGNSNHTRTQTRPEVIITTPQALERGTTNASLTSSASTSTSSTTSTPTTSLASASSTISSSFSTSSGYFFSSTVQFGSLSTPSSPGLSGIGGPDGQTVLDVEALCRDLAFRSFPTQHQWSKKSKKPPTWYPSSSSSTTTSTATSGLPPLPPLPSASSSSISTSPH
ncbi:hypothetical protein BGX24_004561 [Mortierella sp. AD032]|nr:hypothetical protein BGX24_004561 [Mortierella sp. AD032]